MKLLKELKIDGMMIYYDSIKLYSSTEHTEYYITPDDMLNLTLGKKKFHVVKKRTRTWIEPKTK